MHSIQETLRRLVEIINGDTSDTEKHHSELYDTHPVSLMLVADIDIPKYPCLIKITNSWKPEWIKNGVQVPTRNASGLPTARVRPAKLIRCSRDVSYNPDLHHISKKNISTSIRYQFDDMDATWLGIVNEERECLGGNRLQEWMLEDVVEAAEEIWYIKNRAFTNSELEPQNNPEFDENARCDICQSYDGEDGNELVFCDGCFVCVHQACYGVPLLPEGPWLCRRCEMGAKSTTQCLLCPNTGGAMKLVDDYKSWCHVTCALWVPEVGFGNIELMEPVNKINEVPQARKNLLCCLCKLHCGAPIQCSVKKCKVAFHATCAFQKNLVMLQELVGSDARLLAHCPKHSKTDYQTRLALLRTPKKGVPSGASSTTTDANIGAHSANHPPKSIDLSEKAFILHNASMGSTDTNSRSDDPAISYLLTVKTDDVITLLQQRCQKRCRPEKQKPPTYSTHLRQNSEVARVIPYDIVDLLLTYWRLKRRSYFCRPIVDIPERWLFSSLPVQMHDECVPKNPATTELVNRCKLIRFSLDRARLVADMVLTREKRKNALHRILTDITNIQLGVLLSSPHLVTYDNVLATAHIGSSMYDDYATLEAAASHLGINVAPQKACITEKARPVAYIVTGNPVVDSLFPGQLVVSESVRKRLQSLLSKRCSKSRKRFLSAEHMVLLSELDASYISSMATTSGSLGRETSGPPPESSLPKRPRRQDKEQCRRCTITIIT